MTTVIKRRRIEASWPPNRDHEQRRRLAHLEKPVIIVSLKNGLYYCGVNMTQSLKWVGSDYRVDAETSSINGLVYGRGETTAIAYRNWLDAWWYLKKHRPASYLALQQK